MTDTEILDCLDEYCKGLKARPSDVAITLQGGESFRDAVTRHLHYEHEKIIAAVTKQLVPSAATPLPPPPNVFR